MVNYSLINVDVEINAWKVSCITVTSVCALFGCYKFIKRRRRVGQRQKKCVLITGCDTGLGRALVRSLDEAGVPVFAGCYTKDGEKVLQNECSTKLTTLALDVKDEDSVNKAYEKIKTEIPKDYEFWGVVNNASVHGGNGLSEFYTVQQFEQVMKVNFFGPVQVVNTFLPLLKKSSGRIVNICSAMCARQVPGYAAFTASKFALLGYTEVLRREKGIWGIHVSAVLPGLALDAVQSNKAQDSLRNHVTELPDDVVNGYGQEFIEKYMDLQSNRVAEDARSASYDPVISAVEHALFAAYPQPKYTCQRFSLAVMLPETVLTRRFLPQQAPKALHD